MADDPVSLFFFFFPKELFRIMAVESNRYAASSWAARAQNIHARQKEDAARTKRSRDSVESRKQIRARLKKSFVPFDAAEYVRLFGLFIGRMLCPHKRRLSYHWALSSTGVIPAGTFNTVMSKNRYGASCVNGNVLAHIS
jgi:hypothetical protein